MLLYGPIRTYSALQADINVVVTWAILNTTTFDTDKCKTMTISIGRGIIVLQLTLVLKMDSHLRKYHLLNTLAFSCPQTYHGLNTSRVCAACLVSFNLQALLPVCSCTLTAEL